MGLSLLSTGGEGQDQWSRRGVVCGLAPWGCYKHAGPWLVICRSSQPAEQNQPRLKFKIQSPFWGGAGGSQTGPLKWPQKESGLLARCRWDSGTQPLGTSRGAEAAFGHVPRCGRSPLRGERAALLLPGPSAKTFFPHQNAAVTNWGFAKSLLAGTHPAPPWECSWSNPLHGAVFQV